MQNYFQRVHEMTPTRFWINNVTREQAKNAIENGATGCTQNPAYTWKMLDDAQEQAYTMGLLDEILKTETDDNMAQIVLQRALVANVAKVFLPMFEESDGRNGYVSIQGDPFHEDTQSIIKHALYHAEAGPNIMAKIPATKEGIEAIEYVASKGVAINATEVMAVRQAVDVVNAYEKGTKGMKNPAPIYYSHISGIYDDHLANVVKEQGIDISRDIMVQAGLSIARKTYKITKAMNPKVGFIGGGARGMHHFTEMVGADAVVTINWKGTADKLIEADGPVMENFFRPVPEYVVDELVSKIDDYRRGYFIDAITAEEYDDFGPVVLFRKSFEQAWRSALDAISKRRNG